MKILAVKKLAQEHNLSTLKNQEQKLLDGETLEIDVLGDDEGEKLTHILGAIWVLEAVEKGMSFNDAIRAFTEKVRKSID